MHLSLLQQTIITDPWTILDKYGTGIFIVYIIWKEFVPLAQNWIIPERRAKLAEEAEDRKLLAQLREERERRWLSAIENLTCTLEKQNGILNQMQTGLAISNERMLEIESDVTVTRMSVEKLLDRNAKIDGKKEKTTPRKELSDSDQETR